MMLLALSPFVRNLTSSVNIFALWFAVKTGGSAALLKCVRHAERQEGLRSDIRGSVSLLHPAQKPHELQATDH
jgi:hypothetical protein